MDPLIEIALITVTGPVILTALNGTQQWFKERRDYRRQDIVAQRLIESNRHVSENAIKTFDKLDNIAATAAVIHTLVNSDLTKSIQGELDATQNQLLLADQLMALHRERGVAPPQQVLDMIAVGKDRIAELTEDLAQRAKQQSIVDSGKVVVT
jgi:hypothetical protein